MDVTLESLARRVAELESGRRRYRIVAGALSLVALGSIVLGGTRASAGERKEWRGHRIVLDDEDGNPRVVIEGEKGKTGFYLYDHKSHVRLGIALDKGHPCLVTYDGAEEPKARLLIGELKDNGVVGVMLLDKDGNLREANMLTPENTALLSFSGADGKVHGVVGCDNDGNASIELDDKDGKTIFKRPGEH
ncbi:MAG TPA: hypothetical protein VFF73_32600 [Planctomycetota bacterium]|nr:hypothetical protein [Planctomycetota bacterium]